MLKLFRLRYWIETNGILYRVRKGRLWFVEDVWFSYDRETGTYQETWDNTQYGHRATVKEFHDEGEAIKAVSFLQWRRLGYLTIHS